MHSLLNLGRYVLILMLDTDLGFMFYFLKGHQAWDKDFENCKHVDSNIFWLLRSDFLCVCVYVSVLLKWKTFTQPTPLVGSLQTFPDPPKTSLCKWNDETFLWYVWVIYHTIYGDLCYFRAWKKKWFENKWHADILIQKLFVLSDIHCLNVRSNALCSIYGIYIPFVMQSWNFPLAITLHERKRCTESSSNFYNEARLDLVLLNQKCTLVTGRREWEQAFLEPVKNSKTSVVWLKDRFREGGLICPHSLSALPCT